MDPFRIHSNRRQRGHLLVGLMVFVAVMMISLLAAAQSWSFVVRRDAEAELIFRGEEYARAIAFYQKETNNYPTDLKQLIKKGPHRHRYIRHLYEDPVAKDGEWGLLYLSPTGQGFINPYASPGATGNLFNAMGIGGGAGGTTLAGGGLPEESGASKARRTAREEQGLEESGHPEGFSDLVQKQLEQYQGNVVGLPIVGVVHKKNESGVKIYKNIANLNDWAFTLLADAPTSPQQGVKGRGPLRNTGKKGLGDANDPIYFNPADRPGWKPGKTTGIHAEREEAYREQQEEEKEEEERRLREEEERRRQEQEEQQDEDDSGDEEPHEGEEEPTDEEPEAEGDGESEDPNAESEEEEPPRP